MIRDIELLPDLLQHICRKLQISGDRPTMEGRPEQAGQRHRKRERGHRRAPIGLHQLRRRDGVGAGQHASTEQKTSTITVAIPE